MEFSDKETLLANINRGFAGGVVPHNAELHIRVVDIDRGMAVAELPFSEKLVGNPELQSFHGGAITSLLDATCGLAVFLALPEPTRIATLDLRIDYMSASASGRPVFARADCYKLTRSVAFTRAVAYHDRPDDPVASAAATFMVFSEGNLPFAEGLRGE